MLPPPTYQEIAKTYSHHRQGMKMQRKAKSKSRGRYPVWTQVLWNGTEPSRKNQPSHIIIAWCGHSAVHSDNKLKSKCMCGLNTIVVHVDTHPTARSATLTWNRHFSS
jgi:hypothetical protein